ANGWFGSAPCQTYPNRRFLMAGTAYGSKTVKDFLNLEAPPALLHPPTLVEPPAPTGAATSP
ncbi:MAG TPA: hypothetical protein VH115_05015, partial [Solirubrobacteraceae bacterium]|nr:hypothetical protein [Solirubrobacteraceae bacterium]